MSRKPKAQKKYKGTSENSSKIIKAFCITSFNNIYQLKCCAIYNFLFK